MNLWNSRSGRSSLTRVDSHVCVVLVCKIMITFHSAEFRGNLVTHFRVFFKQSRIDCPGKPMGIRITDITILPDFCKNDEDSENVVLMRPMEVGSGSNGVRFWNHLIRSGFLFVIFYGSKPVKRIL